MTRKRAKKHPGWVGVDLDGTLAKYDRWRGLGHIGEPIPRMVKRVKALLVRGVEVRIFTARVHQATPEAIALIERWSKQHIGVALAVTNVKDFDMIELWDDRAIAVHANTGRKLGGRSRIDAKYPR